jgi:uncharacterized metal-binding protein YceD (DUF177 family)
MNESSILSRPYDTAHLPATGAELGIDASAGQRAALANAYDLLAVERLVATATLTPAGAGTVTVEGRVVADIVQSCVVSLEPVAQHIDEPFSVRFASTEVRNSAAREIAIDPEAQDPPEVMDGTTIDVGALVEEMFVLAIDPYPRAPGADLPVEPEQQPETAKESPFAVLRQVVPRSK